MESKQREHYTKLTAELTSKVADYKEFQKQIDSIKADAKRKIKSYSLDMKHIEKEIKEGNAHLKLQGQPVVDFTPIKKTKKE